jgi:peptide/nickel transport system substrate-binding protein
VKENFKKILNKEWREGLTQKLLKIISDFNMSEKFLFYILCLIFTISGLSILNDINKYYTVYVPADGGYLKEGIVGSPRFINPVLAVSDVDHDLSVLIYSGLMKASPDGYLITDLAKSYSISTDGLQYDFVLKDDVYFHDGEKVTTDDIEFTINKIQDSSIKSPKRPSFYDVRLEKLSATEIKFILKKPYAPFLENLTIGILPKHIWNGLNSDEFPLSQYNVEPIGSGPYKISKMETLQKNMLLIPTYYELKPYDRYALGTPFIEKLIINFYRDEKTLIESYNKGEVEAINSISPNKITEIKMQKESVIKTSPLPRVFVAFFNQNESDVLSLKEVRQALNLSVNRQNIVDNVLGGYGKPVYGPIPASFLKGLDTEDVTSYNEESALTILTKAGWVKNEESGILEKKLSSTKTVQLKLVISTLNSQDLVRTAEYVKNDWEKIGAQVEIKQFEFGDLQQNIIRPRQFEILLYGTVTGRDMDFFAFWHSSQRNDPGLNISMYTNSKVDSLLEEARSTQDEYTRMNKYLAFQDELKKEIPAVFLYSPDFIYITPRKIKNVTTGIITLPYDRFLNINGWYIEMNNLWKAFLPDNG